MKLQLLTLLTTLLSTSVQATDAWDVIHECYDNGIYTIEILEIVEANLPDTLVIDTTRGLEDTCYELYLTFVESSLYTEGE